MIPGINGSEDYTGKSFLFPSGKVLVDGYLEYAEIFLDRLRHLDGYHSIQASDHGGEVILVLQLDPTMEKEAYRLKMDEKNVRIESGSDAGIAHALTTLYWIIRENSGVIPCGEICDAPQMEYRGFLFDPCRHFFDLNTAKSMVEQASLRKLNRMHLHLSDDQGYRLESQKFPKLNSVGSVRTERDGNTSQGFYTFDELRELVAFAKKRGVEVIPEIDMPGHVTAMVAAYPELSCSGEPVAVSNSGGIHPRILCAGKNETLSFAKALLDEIIPLFPNPYFHIGGDEAPKSEWEKCPLCQGRRMEQGLKDMEALQGWFTQEIAAYLKEKGKTAICWNEVLRADSVDDEVAIQYWDEEDLDVPGDSYCARAFQKNRTCIFSNAPHLYLDYEPSLLPLRKVFHTKPILRSGDRIRKENLLGMEAALWSERIFDRNRLEQMAFPRLFALAEITWSAENDYEAFVQRCAAEVSYLEQDNIGHFSMEEADICGESQISAVIDTWKPSVDMAKAAGMTMFLAPIRRLIGDKLQDQLTQEQLHDLFDEIFG